MLISEKFISMVNPALIFLLCLLVLLGYKKGFLSKILSCISFLVIVVVGWMVAPSISSVFQILPKELAPYQDTPLADFFYTYSNQILIFVIIVILSILVLFILKPLVDLFSKLPMISFFNATLGAFLGVIEMVLLCFALLFVLKTPIFENGHEVIAQTSLQHFEVLQEKVFMVGKDLIQEFDVLSDSLNSDVNIQDLKQLLSEHGYSDEMIQDFIRNIGK